MNYKVGFITVCISASIICILLIWNDEKHDFSEKALTMHSFGYKEINQPLKVLNKLLNLNNFDFLIENKPCTIQNLKAIQLVTSYAGNIEARNALRKAYSNIELHKMGIVRIFLLAQLKSIQPEITQEDLINENEKFHDLLQGNFLESYRNLTYKHIMGLKWASLKCNQAKYIIKMDDDILVNMYELMDLIEINEIKGFELLGYIIKNMIPIRLKSNKWYVNKIEYKDNIYPNFLSGWLYVTTPKVATKLVTLADTAAYFWIDDLFITGILAKRGNITLKGLNEFFTFHPELFECCIRKKVKCGFSIGPSGNNHLLQIAFQNHSRHCYINSCPTLEPKRKLEKTCVAKRHQPSLERGVPSLKIIKLNQKGV